MRLHGIDFTSAPTRRKPITIASGRPDGGDGDGDGVGQGAGFVLESLTSLSDFAGFEHWLQQPGPWLGGFDFPFSFPRELIQHLGWPTDWAALIRQVAALQRAELRLLFKAFCDARPAGSKFAHRATDIPAGSSSPMKWVNPPVAYMLHAGAPRLLKADVCVYGQHAGDPTRIALEAYPGLIARSITRASYKNDDPKKQTQARHAVRVQILETLETGVYPLGIRLNCGVHRDALIDDASGDLLDAVLCALVAAWSWQRRDSNFGLPEFDALEGWIAGA